MNQSEMFKELDAAEDLEAAVHSEADAQALQELRAEVAQKRREGAANIGHNALVGLSDGSIAPAAEVQQAFAEQQDVSGPVNGGAHSAN